MDPAFELAEMLGWMLALTAAVLCFREGIRAYDTILPPTGIYPIYAVSGQDGPIIADM